MNPSFQVHFDSSLNSVEIILRAPLGATMYSQLPSLNIGSKIEVLNLNLSKGDKYANHYL